MQYLSEILELIKIANLLLPYEEMPDYADEIHTRFRRRAKFSLAEAIGRPATMRGDGGFFLTMQAGISQSGFFVEVTKELWGEIENKYPQLAQYVVNAHKTVLGRFFNKPNENYKYEKYLENFIRFVRIGENIQRVTVLTSGWSFNLYSSWQNDNYSIHEDVQIHPFTINTDGTAKFSYGIGIVQFYLEKVDVLRIKACVNCSRVFWAKPKHTKYCSNECRNRQNVKNNYKKNKLVILEKKKQSYKNKEQK